MYNRTHRTGAILRFDSRGNYGHAPLREHDGLGDWDILCSVPLGGSSALLGYNATTREAHLMRFDQLGEYGGRPFKHFKDWREWHCITPVIYGMAGW